MTEALRPACAPARFIFNTLLHDKAVDDRLRSYPTLDLEPQPRQRGQRRVGPGARRGRPRQLRPAAALVRAQGAAARARPARRLRPLGVGRRRRRTRSRGTRRPRSCSTPSGPSRPPWPTGPGSSSTSAGSTRPSGPASAAARSAPTPSRACTRTSCSTTRARRRDVLTLAHELGHGLHAALAQPARGPRAAHAADAGRDGVGLRRDARLPPAARRRRPPESRLALLAENIEGSIATVFRQVAMNRFEHLAHTARRERGRAVRRALRRAVGRLADGAARRRGRGHRQLPHVVVLRPPLHRDARLRLRLRLRPAAGAVGLRPLPRGGRGFVPRYLDLLGAGGSRSPEELAPIAGLDLADPGFWAGGLELVRAQLEAAEERPRRSKAQPRVPSGRQGGRVSASRITPGPSGAGRPCVGRTSVRSRRSRERTKA